MAAAAASCCASLDLTFLRPNTTANRHHFSLSRRNSLRKLNRYSSTVTVRDRIRAVQREQVIIVDKEDRKVDVGGNGNGNGSYVYVNGVENRKKLNGSVGGENGSLVKYVNGNGHGDGGSGIGKKTKKKKTIEEIGQEDAWFKRSGKGKVEVYVLKIFMFLQGFMSYDIIMLQCVWIMFMCSSL